MNYSIPRFAVGKEIQRFIRYIEVGGLCTGIDFVLLIGLQALGLPTAMANVLSYSSGIAVNFSLNRRWTFPDSRSKTLHLQFLQFAAVSLGGLLLNTAIVVSASAAFERAYGMPLGASVLAKILATLVSLTWNFTVNRLWTFNDIG